jgi:hypothetical protein|tara:strand:+ start:686 stop:928 length:243 start_codon:yes stop_codon:yes gene_type:complete
MYWIAEVLLRKTGETKTWFVQAPYSKKRTKEILVSAYTKDYDIIKVVKDRDANAGVKMLPSRRELLDGIIQGDIVIGDTP